MVNVGDLDAEALGDIVGPRAPSVLHQVSPKLYAPHAHRNSEMGGIWGSGSACETKCDGVPIILTEPDTPEEQ